MFIQQIHQIFRVIVQRLSQSVGITNIPAAPALSVLYSVSDLPKYAELCCIFLQIGMSDKSVLRDFHPDAEDLYNVTMDLATVCKELKDRNKRMPRRVMTSLCLT